MKWELDFLEAPAPTPEIEYEITSKELEISRRRSNGDVMDKRFSNAHIKNPQEFLNRSYLQQFEQKVFGEKSIYF